MTARRLTVGAVLLAATVAIGLLLGISPVPWGSAPESVRSGTDCPQDGDDVLVEGPGDRPLEDADVYPPGRDWSFLGYELEDELEDELGVTYALAAENRVKSGLPWRVRFGVEWDSEGGLLAAYGDRDQICMVARVAHWRIDG